MRDIGLVPDGAVVCRDGRIAWAGPEADLPPAIAAGLPELDADRGVVLPGFVDSHTHMMFAGDRSGEFALRCAGATYQEIAGQGGGILNTVRHVREAGKKDLKRSTARYLAGMMQYGTTTVEIKSGYGLDMDTEVRMLEAIRELADEEMMTVISTYCGAHAVPPEFRGDPGAYVRLITGKVLPYIGGKRLAAFCDVFCERGYFDVDASAVILEAARAQGMELKIHADEITASGGAELAGRLRVVSADHLEQVTEAGIVALREGGVVATLLPGVSFFLNHGYAPARRLIDAGVPVAIASDFNPGSCMSWSMPLMMTIACTQMRMTPEEALTAATLNAAAALNRSAAVGSIEAGKQADLLVVAVPDWRHLAYHFGVNHVRVVVKNGTILEF